MSETPPIMESSLQRVLESMALRRVARILRNRGYPENPEIRSFALGAAAGMTGDAKVFFRNLSGAAATEIPSTLQLVSLGLRAR